MNALFKVSMFLFIMSGCFSCRQDEAPGVTDVSEPEVPCEPEEEVQQELPWDYPVKPGTEGWRQLHSHDEMIATCQIPEDVLSGLSTADLTDICLNYPLLADVLAFDNPNLGLDNLFGNFNGIRELYRRKEVSENLLKHYDRHLHRLCLQNGAILLTVVLDELLLSRVEWHEESDREEFTELLRGLVAGYKARLDYESEFTDFLRINYFARAHIISKMNPQSLETLPENSVKALLYNGRITGETVLLFNQLSYKLIDK